MEPLLDIRRLSMRFGGLTAVSELDLAVAEGSITAVIGPNGAGKTTVFNAVTGTYAPTEGHILFQGRHVSRAFTWKVAGWCALVGLLTGLFAALFSLNVNALWRATVRRTWAATGAGEGLAWADARREFDAYLRGDLTLAPRRGGRSWEVTTMDGAHFLGIAPTREAAAAVRDDIETLLPLVARGNVPIEERGGKSAALAAPGGRALLVAADREALDRRLAVLRAVDAARASRRSGAWGALVGGVLLGGACAAAVWRRSRRTPDVIARSGIARTFQNIRLFQNMTVVENLLVAMDGSFREGFLSRALHLPRVRRAEGEAERRALDLLAFVGLAARARDRAGDLPYGDQRRLEIARALATQPRLLLLDEPAAGMNPSEKAGLMALIRRVRDRGVTVLLIEHDMNVVMGISERIAVLDHGVKIAEGRPEEVRADPRVIEAYLGKDEAPPAGA